MKNYLMLAMIGTWVVSSGSANAPVLLATLVVDTQSRIPASDARAWNRVGRPDREPTDPDAWENRGDSRLDGGALAPYDR